MDDQDQNQQGTLIEETPTTPSNNEAIVLINLEEMIKNNVARMDELQGEIREQKEMLDNVLVNSETYRDHVEKAKEANQIKSQTRAEIMKQPSVLQVAHKVKDLKAELSELQSSLSEYLGEYQRLAQTNIIETAEGDEREIINIHKLIKRASKKQ